MITLVLEDVQLQARLKAVARPEETPEMLLKTAVDELIARRERETARWEKARREAQAELNSPFRPYDPQAAYQRDREKYGWTEDLSTLTDEELAARVEATLDAMPPEKFAELERLGLL